MQSWFLTLSSPSAVYAPHLAPFDLQQLLGAVMWEIVYINHATPRGGSSIFCRWRWICLVRGQRPQGAGESGTACTQGLRAYVPVVLQDLRRSNFTSADCRKCNFKDTNLQGAYFIKAVVPFANFEVLPHGFCSGICSWGWTLPRVFHRTPVTQFLNPWYPQQATALIHLPGLSF
jgi:hypothetical protein